VGKQRHNGPRNRHLRKRGCRFWKGKQTKAAGREDVGEWGEKKIARGGGEKVLKIPRLAEWKTFILSGKRCGPASGDSQLHMEEPDEGGRAMECGGGGGVYTRNQNVEGKNMGDGLLGFCKERSTKG